MQRDNIIANKPRMLGDGSLELSIQCATHLKDKLVQIIQAFERLQAVIDILHLRLEKPEYGRTSIAASKHFKILGKATVAMHADLVKTQDLSKHELQAATNNVQNRRVLPALTAINNLTFSVMELYPKLRRIDGMLDKTLDTTTFTIKLELDAINCPQAIMSWKKEYGDWLAATKDPAWMARKAELGLK